MDISALFVTDPLTAREHMDIMWEENFMRVHGMVREHTDASVATRLSESMETVPIIEGLLYMILVDDGLAEKALRHLEPLFGTYSDDIMGRILFIAAEKYDKLLRSCRSQLVYLAEQLVVKDIPCAENIVFQLIRNVRGGDLEDSNLWLEKSLLDLLTRHMTWLSKHTDVLRSALYSFTRMMADHFRPEHRDILASETVFCISVWNDHWNDAVGIGRDMLRVLQDVAAVPEFHNLWEKRLLQKGPDGRFPVMEDILGRRTPRKILLSRVTFAMEQRLLFLLTKVPRGMHRRYNTWFVNKFLAANENESLVCDLVRFVCSNIHPTNEMLASNVTERWVVIGWLLRCVRTSQMAQSAKLALFIDWFSYSPENIMFVEPGVLVMYHSLGKYTNITATLLEFLCLISSEYFPPLKEAIHKSIFEVFSDCSKKGVIPGSLSSMLGCEAFSKPLADLVQAQFSPLLSRRTFTEEEIGRVRAKTADKALARAASRAAELARELADESDGSDVADTVSQAHLKRMDGEAGRLGAERLPKTANTTTVSAGLVSAAVQLTETGLQQLQRSAAPLLEDLASDNPFNMHSAMVRILGKFSLLPNADGRDEAVLAYLVRLLSPAVMLSLDDRQSAVLGALFEVSAASTEAPPPHNLRTLAPKSDSLPDRRGALLLARLAAIDARIGYKFLNFLRLQSVGTASIENALAPYVVLAAVTPEQSLEDMLVRDLTCSKEAEKLVFFELLPFLFRTMGKVCAANPRIVHLMVHGASSSQILGLSLSGATFFFDSSKDNHAVAACLCATKDWDEEDVQWAVLLLLAERKRLNCTERAAEALSLFQEHARPLSPIWRLHLMGVMP